VSDTTPLARLIVPAIRWDRSYGFSYLDGLVAESLELGVGGFVIEGGPRDAVQACIERLRRDSPHALLIALLAEAGVGQHVEGATCLPPLGAIAAAAALRDAGGAFALDLDAVRRSARICALDARSLGANWLIGPDGTLTGRRDASDHGIRSAGHDPAMVRETIAEWVDACQAEQVMACIGDFPGAVRGNESIAAVRTSHLQPFVGAVDAGVSSVMASAAELSALGAANGAMRSSAVVAQLLRSDLGYDGLVTTPVLDRCASLDASSEPAAVVDAIIAGCDVVLAPSDVSGANDALANAHRSGVLPDARARDALARVERLSAWMRPGNAASVSLDDRMWARQLADRAVSWVSGARPRVGLEAELVLATAPALVPPTADTLVTSLDAMHVTTTVSSQPSGALRVPLIVALMTTDTTGFAVPREVIERARSWASAAAAAGREAAIVVCAHPEVARAFPGSGNVLCAWSGDRAMQEAAARALVNAAGRA